MDVCFLLLDRLLAEHNCVVIPDFGGFIGSYRPARLRMSDGMVDPPGKQFAFNPRLHRQDGLLVDALAEREGIGYAEAEARVNAFAAHCTKELHSQRLLRLPGIGKLLLEDGDKIRFAPQASNAHWQDAYGLPTLDLEPQLRTREATEAAILEERQTVVPVEAKPEPVVMDRWSPRRWGWAAAVLLVLFGTWQILVVTSSLPHSMAFLYPSASRPVVIEEGKAAVLHPLVPSLARQMDRYGATAPLSAVSPTAVRPDLTEAVVLSPNDAGPEEEQPDVPASKPAAGAGVEDAGNTDAAGNSNPAGKTDAMAPDLARTDSGPASTPDKPKANDAATSVAPSGAGPDAIPADWRQPKMDGDAQVPPLAGYYVVIGSYRSAALADKRIRRCSTMPGPSAILRAPNGNYRAALFVSANKADAVSVLPDMRKSQDQSDAWLLRYRP